MPCVVPGTSPTYFNALPKGVCDSLGGRYFPETSKGFADARSFMSELLNPSAPTAADLPGGLGDRITPTTDHCRLARKWKLDQRLARALVVMSGRLEFGIEIISGYRSPEKQRALEAQGRPAAPVDVSTHTWCPATGADLTVSIAPVRSVKARLGAEAVRAGLRWGGGSPVDRAGIPSDWNHVDLGPRSLNSR